MLILPLFVEITKFKSFLAHIILCKNPQTKKGSGYGEILTPWRTATHERPFPWEGNYLVLIIWSQGSLYRGPYHTCFSNCSNDQ